MSAVLAIALKDLRQRLRDRSAIVLGFIAPVAVAALISVAFGSAGSFHANVAVVDLDGGPVATGFTTFVKGPDLAGLLTVKPVTGEADARAKVSAGDLGAAFVIPRGFSEAVTSGGAARSPSWPVSTPPSQNRSRDPWPSRSPRRSRRSSCRWSPRSVRGLRTPRRQSWQPRPRPCSCPNRR